MKDALARKFEFRSGPYAVAEGTEIFALEPVAEQSFYQPYDLLYEEFKRQNAGRGYPLFAQCH